jgi:hypothetical protein
MYEQSNSLLYIQKKQLAWLLAGIFVVIVSAITLSALLVNTLVKGQVASALNNQVVPAVQVLPAQAVTSSSCTSPGDSGSAASAGGIGAGPSAASLPSLLVSVSNPALEGGRGAGVAAPHRLPP